MALVPPGREERRWAALLERRNEMAFQGDIEKIAKRSSDFRKVVATGKYGQLVVMSILPGEDVGTEVHPSTDQIFFVVEGEGKAVLNGKTSEIEENDVVFVSAGTEHNLINTKKREDLKLVTIYAPPQHADGTIHHTKAEAMAEEVVSR
jgi:mannose-6-phosphate isomerase-like protein (cupin superfamily)